MNRTNIPLLAVLWLPFVEMVLLIYAGSILGFSLTFGLLFISGTLGSWLLRSRAPANWMELMMSVQKGRPLTAPDLLDPMLTALAAVLLIIPGFVSDALAIILLVPFLRKIMISYLLAHGLWVSTMSTQETSSQVIEGNFRRDS